MIKSKRVFIGGIWHETNTFSSKKTYIKDFKSYQWHEGIQIIEKNLKTNTEIGGFLDIFNQKGFRIQPSLFAAAVPSGIVTKKTFLKIVKIILSNLDKEDIDGVALALHGALVVEGIDLPEHFLIKKIKNKLKKNIPIVATFDLHANLSLKLFEICDMLIGYDTFPHIDMGERGKEAAMFLCKMIEKEIKPKKYFKKIPFITVPQMQSTNEFPMKQIMKSVFNSEQKQDIELISVSPGFPYSDIKDLGITVTGYGLNSKTLNQECDNIIDQIFKHKNNFSPQFLTINELDKKLSNFNNIKKPIVIADPSDNVGGGALGNNIEILEILVKKKLPGTIVIWSPFLQRKKYKDKFFSGYVGSNLTKKNKKLIKIEGDIIFNKRNFSYIRDGLYMTGQQVKMGNVLVVRTKFNLKIILTENRIMPFDDKHIKVFGINPKKEDIIVTKSGSAWKIAFGKIAKTIFNVDTDDICSSNLKRFNFSKIDNKRYWPLNE